MSDQENVIEELKIACQDMEDLRELKSKNLIEISQLNAQIESLHSTILEMEAPIPSQSIAVSTDSVAVIESEVNTVQFILVDSFTMTEFIDEIGPLYSQIESLKSSILEMKTPIPSQSISVSTDSVTFVDSEVITDFTDEIGQLNAQIESLHSSILEMKTPIPSQSIAVSTDSVTFIDSEVNTIQFIFADSSTTTDFIENDSVPAESKEIEGLKDQISALELSLAYADKLKIKNNDNMELIVNLKEMISEQEIIIRSQTDEKRNLKTRIEYLNSHVSVLETALSSSDSLKMDYQDALDRLELLKQQLADKESTFLQNLSAVTFSHAEVMTTYSAADFGGMTDPDQHSIDLNQQLEDSKLAIKSHLEERKYLNTRIDYLNSHVSVLETSLEVSDSLKMDYQDALERLEMLKQQLSEKDSISANLSVNVNFSDAEVLATQIFSDSQVMTEDDGYSELQKKLKSAMDIITFLESKLNSSNAENAEGRLYLEQLVLLKKEFAEAKSSAEEELEREREKSRYEVENVSSKLAESLSVCEILSSKLVTFEDNLRSLNSSRQDLLFVNSLTLAHAHRDIVKSFESSISSLKLELDAAKSLNESLQMNSNIESIRSRELEADKSIQNSLIELSNLKSELEEERYIRSDLENKVKASISNSDILEMLRKENKSLQELLDSYQSKNVELQEHSATKDLMIDTLSGDIVDIKKLIEELTLERDNLKFELDLLTDSQDTIKETNFNRESASEANDLLTSNELVIKELEDLCMQKSLEILKLEEEIELLRNERVIASELETEIALIKNEKLDLEIKVKVLGDNCANLENKIKNMQENLSDVAQVSSSTREKFVLAPFTTNSKESLELQLSETLVKLDFERAQYKKQRSLAESLSHRIADLEKRLEVPKSRASSPRIHELKSSSPLDETSFNNSFIKDIDNMIPALMYSDVHSSADFKRKELEKEIEYLRKDQIDSDREFDVLLLENEALRKKLARAQNGRQGVTIANVVDTWQNPKKKKTIVSRLKEAVQVRQTYSSRLHG